MSSTLFPQPPQPPGELLAGAQSDESDAQQGTDPASVDDSTPAPTAAAQAVAARMSDPSCARALAALGLSAGADGWLVNLESPLPGAPEPEPSSPLPATDSTAGEPGRQDPEGASAAAAAAVAAARSRALAGEPPTLGEVSVCALALFLREHARHGGHVAQPRWRSGRRRQRTGTWRRRRWRRRRR